MDKRQRRLGLPPIVSGVSGRDAVGEPQADTPVAEAAAQGLEGVEEAEAGSGSNANRLAHPVGEVLRPSVHATAPPADPPDGRPDPWFAVRCLVEVPQSQGGSRLLKPRTVLHRHR